MFRHDGLADRPGRELDVLPRGLLLLRILRQHHHEIAAGRQAPFGRRQRERKGPEAELVADLGGRLAEIGRGIGEDRDLAGDESRPRLAGGKVRHARLGNRLAQARELDRFLIALAQLLLDLAQLLAQNMLALLRGKRRLGLLADRTRDLSVGVSSYSLPSLPIVFFMIITFCVHRFRSSM